MKRFLSFGYLALMSGGLMLASGALLEGLNRPGDPFSQQVTTSAFVLSAALRLLGATFILVGVTAVYVRQAERAATFGLVAYVLVVINLVLQLGAMWSDLFITDMLSKHAPGLLDGTTDQGRLAIGFMLAWLVNATFILLGISILRARVFPRTVGWGVLAVGVVTLLPLPVDGPWFEVLIGAALALAGWSAQGAGTDLAAGLTGAEAAVEVAG